MREKLKSIRIDEFMSRFPETVTLQASYKEIVDLLENKVIRHLPVLDGKKVVGIISQRNLKLPSKLADVINIKAQDIMTADPFTAQPETAVDIVTYTMAERGIGSAIIVSSYGELLGIFTTIDALNALTDIVRGEVP